MTRIATATLLVATLCVSPALADTVNVSIWGDIQTAIDGATGPRTIVFDNDMAAAGTAMINKADITIDGGGHAVTATQPIGNVFRILADGATIKNLSLQKTDKAGVQNLIYVQADNAAIQDSTISGEYVMGDPDTSRAFEVAYGSTGLSITGNTIYGLRQPGYLNGSLASPTTGTIANNYVYGTRGWVIAGANMTFTGNTWGTGATANVYDIVILSGTDPSYYTDILAISAANNNASIEDQRTSPATLSAVYVDAAAAPGGTGTAASPYQTITLAIPRVVAGGTIHVAAGTYNETVTLDKSAHLIGAGCGSTIWRGSAITSRSLRIIRNSTTPANIDVEITGFSFETENNQSIFADWSTGYTQIMTLDIHHNCFAHVNSRNPGNDFGLWVDGARQAARGTQGAIRVHDNTFDVVTGGVLFENCRAVDVIGNTFNTTYEGVAFNYYGVSGSYGEQLVAENVFNHVVVDWAFAINNWHESGGFTILPSVVTHNQILGPNFTYAIVYGVVDSQASTHDFTIVDNALLSGSVRVWGDYASQVVLNASGNWWGSAASPAGRVTADRVDYTPWLAAGTDTGDPGFRGDFSSLWVDDSSPQVGTKGRIQEGIDMASGSTVNVAAGTYDEPLNIEGKSGLNIVGENKATTIVKSSTTLPWNVGGYTTQRQAMVRIVSSSNILLQNLTLDGALISGNNRFALLGFDSSVTLDNCLVQNMSLPDASGYYAELGAYFRAPGYTDASRAAVNVTNCTFTNAGRVGVVTHDYISATIQNNVFCKTIDDFGYGVELGSQSTGTIRSNAFYGFDTPAASDGSESAGIYIENCFTGAVTSPLAKNVLVENNDIYGCQYGMWIGNGYNGYAGNVDIAVTLNNNSFHDNTDGGAWIQDEDKAAGSSVTVTGGGNTWKDNGPYGMRIYTTGDGDITVSLDGEVITGQNIGVAVEDLGSPSASSYAISFVNSSIAGNTSYGINNTVAGVTVDADNNWWGDASGPYHPDLNSDGTGNAVSDGVGFEPYMESDPGVNILKLDVIGNPVYLQPGEAVTIDMEALNLAQHVIGCQAVLNFSSSFFVATPSGAGSPVVATGGGIWTEMIYQMWTTDGDLDVAVGVTLSSPVGTKEDGTVAKFTLTAKNPVTDGTTQMVFRADNGDTASTFFSDLNAAAVYPGSKLASQSIVIDGTAPTGVTIAADPAGWTNADTVVLTFSATDATAGIDHYELSIDGGLYFTAVSPYSLDVTSLADGTRTATVKAVDKAGNEATASTNFYLDNAAPSIAITAITPANVGTGGCALQGDVDIAVTASDALSGLAAPTVTVSGMTVSYLGQNPVGTFNYRVTVDETTTNGTHTVDASVTDTAGNTGNAVQSSFCVNKNEISGQVQLENFVGSSRVVTFVATGGTTKTWNLTLTGWAANTAAFTLTDVPEGTTGLSAKTPWNLREKLAVTLVDGLATVDFVADGTAGWSDATDHYLRGGDLNGTNSVNVLDYGVLKNNWFTTNPVADINGNGQVDLVDYSLIKTNWFKSGDAE